MTSDETDFCGPRKQKKKKTHTRIEKSILFRYSFSICPSHSIEKPSFFLFFGPTFSNNAQSQTGTQQNLRKRNDKSAGSFQPSGKKQLTRNEACWGKNKKVLPLASFQLPSIIVAPHRHANINTAPQYSSHHQMECDSVGMPSTLKRLFVSRVGYI